MKSNGDLKSELKNLERKIRHIAPENKEIPNIKGFNIYGKTLPLYGFGGGDHLTYVDFKQRYVLGTRLKKSRSKRVTEKLKFNRKRGGILISDVAGHDITDAYYASQLHQAFLTGALYELELFGEITTHLFENLNTRFYESSSSADNITLLYGEIAQNGIFRFISAGHPMPLIFSNKKNQIIDLKENQMKRSFPIGFIPSENGVDVRKHKSVNGFEEGYKINELRLRDQGDMCVLFTDGFEDHFEDSFKENIEGILKNAKNLTARGIFNRIKKRIYEFGKPEDDISYVIIKKDKYA